jgi:LL-diaminopimelate aminotransferase
VPKQLKASTKDGKTVEVNPVWNRRHCTKFNGASYISQAGAAAIYTPQGKMQIRKMNSVYMNNAALIRTSLAKLGYEVHGGVNAPYIWMKTPDGISSWDFFDKLLTKARIVTTPGAGFGPAGEGFLRLSAFAEPKNVKEAIKRFAAL